MDLSKKTFFDPTRQGAGLGKFVLKQLTTIAFSTLINPIRPVPLGPARGKGPNRPIGDLDYLL